MIEVEIRRFLTNKLADVSVYVGEKPIDKPKEYVLIEILESGRENCIDSITLDFKSFSETLNQAAILNKRVKDAILDSVELDNIASAKYGGGGQDIDTETKTKCYDCVFNFYYYD